MNRRHTLLKRAPYKSQAAQTGKAVYVAAGVLAHVGEILDLFAHNTAVFFLKYRLSTPKWADGHKSSTCKRAIQSLDSSSCASNDVMVEAPALALDAAAPPENAAAPPP